MSRPFGGFIDRKIGQIDAAYADYLSRGFPTADFEDQPEPETLQCRNEHDRTNWLALLLKCQAASALGAGAVPCDPPLRCSSNRMYAVSYDDAQARLWALFAQAAGAQANWWALKDATRACEKREDLELIDITGGYP